MSWEDDWPLDEWPTRGELRRAIAETVARGGLATPTVTHAPFDGDDEVRDGFGVANDFDRLPFDVRITLVFRVAVRDALEVALRFDPTLPRQAVVDNLDPPGGDLDMEAAEREGSVTHEGITTSISDKDLERFTTRPDHYEIAVVVVAPDEDNPARVGIYSNERHNREAYPVLVVLADTLAARLLAITKIAN